MNRLFKLMMQRDIVLAVVISLVVGMLVLPISPWMLDICLTINIALAVTIMLVTINTNEALEYSTFPTILLVATLFRLGLNVSTTRLVLTQANAGQVVHAFGSFVVGGNYIVGVLIFIILVIINFIVITNGAGRVAEVSARFTLDAMPGKQISIDADLNAGLITEAQAKERRMKIQKEADFYGTMDGASKFVKGDAIAGIIIVVINIVGGLVLGVFQMNMPIEQAVQTFTVLTIGDGLVSQLPALIISTATGILMTRVAQNDMSLGQEIQLQMFTNPKVLGVMGGLLTFLVMSVVAALLFALGLIPGLPTIPFLSIGLIAGGGAYMMHKNMQKREAEAAAVASVTATAEDKKLTKKPGSREAVMELLQVEPLELEIGYRLVPLLEGDQGGDLLDRITQIRRQMAIDLGLVLPSVRVRDNLQLSPNQYNLKLRGVVIETGEIRADMLMAMNTDGSEEPIQGIETKEPAFNLTAWWIYPDQKEDAEMKGYTVVSPSAVAATHISETVKRYASDLLSRLDVQNLLDNLKQTSESLVNDVIPDVLTVSELHVVLQNLLRERVSIRDLATILDSLGYHARVAKNPDYLTEQVRMALSRNICKQFQDDMSGELPVITLSSQAEDEIASGLSDDKLSLALPPNFTQGLLNAINQQVESALLTSGLQPVILCNASIRLPLRRLIERMLPQIAVLSYNEIGPSVKIKALGNVVVDGRKATA